MMPGGLGQGQQTGLWLALGDGLVQFLRGAPGGEAWLCGGSALVISGEPAADLNYALIGPGPDAPALLRRFAAELRRRGLPAWIEVEAGVAAGLGPLRDELGLTDSGLSPVMVRGAQPVAAASSGYVVGDVRDGARLGDACAVIAAAFGFPARVADRAFGTRLISYPATDIWLARRGRQAIAAAITTRTGSSVALWAMATRPDRRHQGAGSALLGNLLEHHLRLGAGSFVLLATPAGRRLYQRFGFQTVSQMADWAIGQPGTATA
jgi:GNAT superfamily N-acetyltransferase